MKATLQQLLITSIVVLSTSRKEKEEMHGILQEYLGSRLSKQSTTNTCIETLGLLPSEMDSLAAEDKVHGDLLLLHDLTRKVLYSFLWADQNINFSYLLKT